MRCEMYRTQSSSAAIGGQKYTVGSGMSGIRGCCTGAKAVASVAQATGEAGDTRLEYDSLATFANLTKGLHWVRAAESRTACHHASREKAGGRTVH